MTGRLDGKRVVVIGAGAIGPGWGNGKAAAMLMAREGARVLAVDRDPDACAEIRDLIRAEGLIAEACTADVTDPDAGPAVVAQAMEAFGGIDVLHYNVGTSRPGGVTEATPEDWDLVFRVNVAGAFYITRAVLPVMAAEGAGACVYVSSIASIRGGPYSYASYEASKAALNRFAQTIAVDHAADGIRANVILPGLIDTPHVTAYMARGADLAELAARRAAIPPMRRQGTPWDIAEAAVFFASDAASYITGQCLCVDGGLSVRMPGDRG